MKKNLLLLCLLSALSLTAVYSMPDSGNSVKEIRSQKQAAEKEIKETRSALGDNEKKVTESMAALRQIEEDMATSRQEIEKVRGQLVFLQDTITSLEYDIERQEADLSLLKDEYLKSIKKMRVARKRNSGAVFIFASKSLGEAKRRMRYMREFSEWKNSRGREISKKMELLHDQRLYLVQAHEDIAVALNRENEVQNALTLQRDRQHATVKELRANSEALKSKLAQRQAEARRLGDRIVQAIAEQQAKEAQLAADRKKAEEEKRIAAQKAEEQRRLTAETHQQKENTVSANKGQNATKKQNTNSKQTESAKKTTESNKTPSNNSNLQSQTPDKSEYATARRRRSRSEGMSTTGQSSGLANSANETSTRKKTASSESGFGGMKGSLPKPVNGSFKIVSAFGRHPISPELPDIMDENHGIDAHVANGASACAVYDGEVIKVYDRTTTTGFRNIIVVKHGDYITVYANLETLAVKAGQHVRQGQSLGTVGTDFDNPKHGMIHFEVWKNQTRLDPAAWIKI